MRLFLIATCRDVADVSPITVSGKSVAGKVTTGDGSATPLPVRLITKGPLVASDDTVSVATREGGATAPGVNTTVIVHEPPTTAGGITAASGVPVAQVLVKL